MLVTLLLKELVNYFRLISIALWRHSSLRLEIKEVARAYDVVFLRPCFFYLLLFASVNSLMLNRSNVNCYSKPPRWRRPSPHFFLPLSFSPLSTNRHCQEVRNFSVFVTAVARNFIGCRRVTSPVRAIIEETDARRWRRLVSWCWSSSAGAEQLLQVARFMTRNESLNDAKEKATPLPSKTC